jgi:NADPH-dependent 2,4-dienoyl-CoA reductase/sulfur reductase-like enzyme
MTRGIPRRDFLKRGALAAAALAVGVRAGAPRRVVVLGAGLAGLAAGTS